MLIQPTTEHFIPPGLIMHKKNKSLWNDILGMIFLCRPSVTFGMVTLFDAVNTETECDSTKETVDMHPIDTPSTKTAAAYGAIAHKTERITNEWKLGYIVVKYFSE